MAEHLLERGYDSDSLMWRADARGTHSEASWRRRLPAALRFMYRRGETLAAPRLRACDEAVGWPAAAGRAARAGLEHERLRPPDWVRQEIREDLEIRLGTRTVGRIHADE